MKVYGFERLKVWQKAEELALLIYKVTADFPSLEKFGLSSQMRRAAISIVSNLAEGSSRHTKKEKARFTEISYGSALELLNQSIISKDLNFISENQYVEIRNAISEITAMLDALHKAQLK